MLKSALLLLKISRPPSWVILPLAYGLGLAYGPNGISDPSFKISPLIIIQSILLTFPVCLFTFGINDIYDVKSDLLNPRKTGIEGITLSEGSHGMVRLSAAVAGLSFLIVSAASANPVNIYFAVTLLVFSYAYSAPPWRFKTRPPLDSLSAGIIGFMAPFGMGYSFAGKLVDVPLHAYLFAFCVMGFHIYSTTVDYSVDKQTGDRTFAVAFGKLAATLLPAAIFLTCFFLLAVIYVKTFFLVCAIMCIISAVFPSEKLARYFCNAMFLGAVAISSTWILGIVLK